MVLVLFAITVLVFLIFFATPGRRPGPRARRAQPDAGDPRGGPPPVRPRPPLPVQYPLMMKQLFISRDLVSYGNQARRSCRRSLRATPVTLSLVFGAAVIWIVLERRSSGVAAAVLRGTIVGPAADDRSR